MNQEKITDMTSIGWNFNEIRDLFKESKRIEQSFVNEKRYENNFKITDFAKVKLYYCSKHHRYHRKYRHTKRNGKMIKVKTVCFERCKNYAYKISKSEKFNKNFNRSLKNYSVDKHKKSVGSRKQ